MYNDTANMPLSGNVNLSQGCAMIKEHAPTATQC